jgi:hypothetical protein
MSGTPDAGVPRKPGGTPGWMDVPGARLANLPPQTAVKVGYFQTSEACAQCHGAKSGDPAMRDAAGRDVSPVSLYRASMMAHAVRDPFYLAAFSHELAARPAAREAIEAACTRCHSPAADVHLRATSKHVGFDMLTRETTPEAHLARDGVGCVLCHQILPGAGELTVSGTSIFGLYPDPLVGPMQFFVSYTPTYGAHMGESELCARCPTVITRALDAAGAAVGPPFYEQATFLEWQSSSYAGVTTCQDCHLPTTDEDDVPIRTVVARPPNVTLSPRSPYGRHLFAGANAYLLGLLADNGAWSGSATPADELRAQAGRSEAALAGAVELAITRATRDGGALVVDVRVENLAGHKLPTGYPSRRLFLHLVVEDPSGAVVFESGAVDGYGRLVDGRGGLLDVPGEVHAHRDAITRDDEVQIYEAVAGDATGAVAAQLLDATTWLKDNRLLPKGFSPPGPVAAIISPVGTRGDASFGSRDTVTYRVPAPAGPARVEVELLHQSLRPTDLEALADRASDATRRFFDMVAARAPLPIRMAGARADVP